MNNYKKYAWPVAKGLTFGLAALASVVLLIKVAGLNMLPMKYLALIILAVGLLLFIIFALLYLLPIKRKNQKVENVEQKEEADKEPLEKKDWYKKLTSKHALRGIGLVLAVVLLVVDIVGIVVVNKVEETFSAFLEGEEKVEEFVVGVYVSANDKAENLEDAKRYDFGYSLAYDRNNTKKAINMIETELDRKLNLAEYDAIPEMVNAVLSGEKDAFILSVTYMDILSEQEEFTDISEKVKCIHECTITVKTEVAEKEETPFDVTKDPFVVYISGHDTNFAANRANSDVNILAAVNPVTKQVLLLNTPRDLYVEISESNEGAMDKLTHCGIYGVDCSIKTLNEFYDVDIKYYAQLNFKGFVRLIDAIGGISVYCEKDVSTFDGYTFTKGINHFNGDQALRFVRERKEFEDGDHARGRHQMAVIKGIIDKMSSGSLLRNYDEIVESMGKYFKCSVPQEDLSALMKMQLDDLAEWNVQSFSIDGTGKKMYTYSLPDMKTYVMIPDEVTVEHAKSLINMVFEGEVIEEEDLELPVEETESTEK